MDVLLFRFQILVIVNTFRTFNDNGGPKTGNPTYISEALDECNEQQEDLKMLAGKIQLLRLKPMLASVTQRYGHEPRYH